MNFTSQSTNFSSKNLCFQTSTSWRSSASTLGLLGHKLHIGRSRTRSTWGFPQDNPRWRSRTRDPKRSGRPSSWQGNLVASSSCLVFSSLDSSSGPASVAWQGGQGGQAAPAQPCQPSSCHLARGPCSWDPCSKRPPSCRPLCSHRE